MRRALLKASMEATTNNERYLIRSNDRKTIERRGSRGNTSTNREERYGTRVVGKNSRRVHARTTGSALDDDDHDSIADDDIYITKEEIEEIGRMKGLRLETERTGPFFKIVARRIGRRTVKDDDFDDDGDEIVIAEHDGFIAPFPFRILHLDTMRVYNSRINKIDDAKERENLKSVFGVSILLGCESLRLGKEFGCTKAELLSIDDGNEYATKLVRYYERLGFTRIRKVGDGLKTDFFDRLVWGGIGTRMNADVDDLLKKWSKVLRSQK